MIKRPKSEEAKKERAIQVANQIYELRASLQLTQTEFAEKIGLTKDGVSKWERGMREPSEQAIKKIFIQFGVEYNLYSGFCAVKQIDPREAQREEESSARQINYMTEASKIIWRLTEEQTKAIYEIAYEFDMANKKSKELIGKIKNLKLITGYKDITGEYSDLK